MKTQEEILFEAVEDGKLDDLAGVHDITPEDADYIEYRLHYGFHAGEIRRHDSGEYIYFSLCDRDPELYRNRF